MKRPATQSMRSMKCAKPRTAPHRSGATYILVVGSTLIVSTLAMSGLLAVRAQSRTIDSCTRTATARQNALSAIEIGIQEIASNTNWRTTHKNDVGGLWFSNRSIGAGTYTLKASNPNGALDRSPTDPVVMTGYGTVSGGVESQMVEVTVVSQIIPFTCLKTAECAGSNISFASSSVDAYNQIVASNATGNAISSGGGATVNAYVEAVGNVSGGGYMSGTPTSGITPYTLPDPTTVFDYYLANGSVININSIPLANGVRTVSNVLISPAANPYGATNAQGIYVIDCAGQAIVFSNSRIVGTLVLLNPMGGGASNFKTKMNVAPAVANYPSFMVKGDFTFKMNATSLVEGAGLNFNPPGTPYPYPSGTADSDAVDSYPCEVSGLVYVSGNLETQTQLTLGQAVAGGTISHIGGLTLGYDPTFFANPAPGFYTLKMLPSPGTWKQVVN